jgi:hypothetical protein
MKRVLFRPQAGRDLEGYPNRDRDQVEEATNGLPKPATVLRCIAESTMNTRGCATTCIATELRRNRSRRDALGRGH